MKKICIILLAICLIFIVSAGCVGNVNPPEPVSNGTFKVTDYGNGIIYIACYGSDIGNAISEYRESHDTPKIEAIVGDAMGPYGTNTGYFIIFEQEV